MMNLTLAETKPFSDSISIISELVNEATFHITKNGLEMTAMDPANVAMVNFKLLGSAFTEYDLKKEHTITIKFRQFKADFKKGKTVRHCEFSA